MLAASDAFFQSESLTYAAAAIALLVAALLLLLNFRRAFRRRLRVPETGNAGRLGIAKTFAFDQSRQLVVVRRDHVEHLVMIGGPNDLVIESDIVGAGGRDPVEIDENWLGEEEAEEKRFTPMPPQIKLAAKIFAGPGSFSLALLSGIAGAGTGLICGFFRLALEEVDRLRTAMPVWWHAQPLLGCSLLVVGAATATAFSATLVRRFSEYAAGSGIPHVEAAISGELPPAPFILLPVKFAGGLLAIGAGLALGREGPCVQMRATLAHLLGKAFGRNTGDRRSLLAAGAGAGLAAAFNAPLAGSAFVLEELIRQFETRNAIAALGASGSAIVVARLFTGPAPDFVVTTIPYPALSDNLLCFALGVAAGLLGAGLQSRASRRARDSGPIRALASGSSRRDRRGGGRGARVVCAEPRRWRRRAHTAHARRHGGACSPPSHLYASPCSRRGVLRGRNAGRPLCASPRFRSANGFPLWRAL